ncbi:hypothetical protein ACVI1J_001804 [Bradyrhizobium diazoefficiens]|uniref:Uncharacterized protein n=1 Tax=Bradyrhizobium huanghuaihaiense TaxID=990078 RepID=A0A562RN80_9BRAD|nr:hypothetical protein IQ16_03652 [Bradyrhizobium huanghuaihaiense]
MLSACATSSQSCEERDEIYLGLKELPKLVTDQDLRGVLHRHSDATFIGISISSAA